MSWCTHSHIQYTPNLNLIPYNAYKCNYAYKYTCTGTCTVLQLSTNKYVMHVIYVCVHAHVMYIHCMC